MHLFFEIKIAKRSIRVWTDLGLHVLLVAGEISAKHPLRKALRVLFSFERLFGS